MQEWATELQRYYASDGSDRSLLGKRASVLESLELKEYLVGYPALDKRQLERGRNSVHELRNAGYIPEALVLSTSFNLLLLQSALQTNGTSFQEQEAQMVLFMESQIEELCSHSLLSPSAALLLAILGHFYKVSGKQDFAIRAFQESMEHFSELSTYDRGLYSFHAASVTGEVAELLRRSNLREASREMYAEAVRHWRTVLETEEAGYEVQMALSLTGLAYMDFTLGDLSTAKKNCEEGCEILREASASDPVKFASLLGLALDTLGEINTALQDLEQALAAYEECCALLKGQDRSDETNAEFLVQNLNKRAQIYGNQGHLEKSRIAIEEAVKVREEQAKFLAPNQSALLALELENLGGICFDAGDYSAAKEAYMRARVVFGELSSEEPMEYELRLALVLTKLGDTCTRMQDLQLAKEVVHEAYEISQRRLDYSDANNQAELLTILTFLGNFYASVREFQRALAVYNRVVDIISARSVSNSSSDREAIAIALTNIGGVYQAMREYHLAAKYYGRAIDIRKDLCEEHPHLFSDKLALNLNNLGALKVEENKLEEAIASLEEAAKIRERLAFDHPETYGSRFAQTLCNLASAYIDSELLDKAENVAKQAKEIAESYDSIDRRDTIRTQIMSLVSLGQIEVKRQNGVGAGPHFRAAVSLVENSYLEKEHIHLFRAYATDAYRFVLSSSNLLPADSCVAAMALRGALKPYDGNSNSQMLGNAQQFLRELDAQRGLRHSLLIFDRGVDLNLISIGLVTSGNCSWWSINCDKWLGLLSLDFNNLDGIARRALSRSIWHALPIEVQEAFMFEDAVNSVLVAGDPLWTAFPWELLCFGDGEDDFVGLHRCLPRLEAFHESYLRQFFSNESLGGIRKGVSIVAPHTTGERPLAGVLKEVEALNKSIPMLGGEVLYCATGENGHQGSIREAITFEPAVLYFSGHGMIIGNEEVLVLHSSEHSSQEDNSSNSYFGRSDLIQLAENADDFLFFQNSPLVVLNSCSTGRVRDHGGKREDLVGAFLSLGAGAVIASALPVLDNVGAVFGSSFFGEQESVMVGEMLLKARRDLANGVCRDMNAVSWGAWGLIHLHGNPYAQTPFS